VCTAAKETFTSVQEILLWFWQTKEKVKLVKEKGLEHGASSLFGLTIFILPQLHRLFNLRRNQRRQTRLVKIE
jgi:hypothetical protein